MDYVFFRTSYYIRQKKCEFQVLMPFLLKMLNCNNNKKESAKRKMQNAVVKRTVTGISSKYRLPGFELPDETGTSTNNDEYWLWKSHENQQGQGLPMLPQACHLAWDFYRDVPEK